MRDIGWYTIVASQFCAEMSSAEREENGHRG